MNKKHYIQPKLQIIVLKVQHQLLYLSDPKTPGVSGAPELDLDDEDFE